MQSIQDLIHYLNSPEQAYELVVYPSQFTEGLWVAMIRESGPDGKVWIDPDTDQKVMQVRDSMPLALAALEKKCGDIISWIELHDWERDMIFKGLTSFLEKTITQ